MVFAHSNVPKSPYFIHLETYQSQNLPTDFFEEAIIKNLLPARRPADAIAYVAFTAYDLWPGRDWNFVFGEASIDERVGVWSFYRFGSPEESSSSYRLALLRTLQVASHETAHVFGIRHCTGFECNMNGSNSLEEADNNSLFLCPSCLQKLLWSTNCDTLKRYHALADFFARHTLMSESAYARESARAVAGGHPLISWR